MSATWDTTQRDDDSLERAPRPQLWLRWVFPATSAAIPLEHNLVIGRDDQCQVHLSGEGVSRRHVEVHRQGPIFALKDLSSTNGTFLNGKRIQHGAVVPGGVLRLGEYIGVFTECVGEPRDFGQIAANVFGSHELDAALGAMQRAAKSDIPVVILGPTGSGKERVARAVHELSGRTGAFQALNCAALPKDLAEAELFGYRKGAFTSADRASSGHFRAADRGTLFLDEIAELPLGLQAKLLRALEERSVTPLGETDPYPIDVRIVTATQRPLAELVAAKQFREDLLARLSGLTVKLPALRERVVDVAQLFQHFMHRYSGGRPPRLEPKLVECLCLHDWPGNVRELEQLARQLLAVHGLEAMLKRSFLPAELLSPTLAGRDSTIPQPLEFAERKGHDQRRLALALKQAGGNVTAAAALVGFSRQRAYRLLNGRTVAEFVAGELARTELAVSDNPDAEGGVA
ncbi:MAG TPA: sigma 54-interacting transcriptional regulator [Polyangiaceae bacterium]|jgi:transcriptional regulator with AAA-type ATPase domain|nr:sigma 54-interacting transcriptional regulator [Polyangiaceae bacterium]